MASQHLRLKFVKMFRLVHNLQNMKVEQGVLYYKPKNVHQLRTYLEKQTLWA